MKFITRDKGSKPTAEKTTDSGMNGPVTVKRIEDYSAEEQARWFNIPPARTSEGKVVRRPIVTNISRGQ